MTVTIEKPKIISLLYKQEKTDKDYGSCLWARFLFDTENYSLHIESDCGNYSYSWCPTPNTESFLHLMARIDKGYLLRKISDRTVVDGEATFESLKVNLEDVCDDDVDWEEVKEYCCGGYDEREMVEEINSEIHNEFIGEYDIWECVQKDYPNNAKKIASVFCNHIIPAIKNIIREDADNGC